MRFASSIFGQLLEVIDRRQFQRIVDRHAGDAYDKSFKSWDHLVALIYAQFCSSPSLRGLEAGWNANSQHHYHLGSGPLTRSSLSDANKRRPVASLPKHSTSWPRFWTAIHAVKASNCCG